ncbi:hypothetical protein PHLCEN_2v9196 [Hermanssonia centrifuga]|uniref:Uncharacterized protein n=1 Tax=Hermanssonia centrifuga TaxID=98765 RepID=A0A2R6NRH4_9APHY|nr:hypothetical protein PHLCEN_2v9196 [Hermanssonia centrifuga]
MSISKLTMIRSLYSALLVNLTAHNDFVLLRTCLVSATVAGVSVRKALRLLSKVSDISQCLPQGMELLELYLPCAPQLIQDV